ncbi:MAG: phosphoribosylglycinamide formyltransferase [Planctomycetota bacterium]
MSARHRIAVFVSGTGRHLENLARLCAAGELDAEVVLCVSNRAGVGALGRAERAGVPTAVLAPEPDETDEAWGRRAFDAVEAAGADTVVLAGFLKKLWIPERWRGRIVNIHPSLLPAFGGKGCYGMRVHRAVVERGCQVTGCTVHVVDEVYDNGPILLQRWCEVRADDTPEDVAARVFAEELIALPAGLVRFWSGRD